MKVLSFHLSSGNTFGYTFDEDSYVTAIWANNSVVISTDPTQTWASFTGSPIDVVRKELEMAVQCVQDVNAGKPVGSDSITGLQVFIPSGTRIYIAADGQLSNSANVHLYLLD